VDYSETFVASSLEEEEEEEEEVFPILS